MLGEKLRPLVAAMAGTAAGFVAASIAAQRMDDDGWNPEQMTLVAAACGGFGALVGALFGSLFSTRLAAYWFWFLAALIGLGVAPLGPAGAEEAAAPLWSVWARGDSSLMFLHSLGAALLAIAATVGQQWLLGSKMADPSARRFGLGEIGIGLLVLATMAYGLHWLGATPMLLLALVSPLAGKQAAMAAVRHLQKPGGEMVAEAGDSDSRKMRWRGAPGS